MRKRTLGRSNRSGSSSADRGARTAMVGGACCAATLSRLDVGAEFPADVANGLRDVCPTFDTWLQLGRSERLDGGRSGVSLAPARLLRMTQRKCFASPSGLMPAPLRMLVMLVSFERALMDRAPSILSQADALGPHAEIQSHATR